MWGYPTQSEARGCVRLFTTVMLGVCMGFAGVLLRDTSNVGEPNNLFCPFRVVLLCNLVI